jgi:PAS domain S-box-containing protein
MFHFIEVLFSSDHFMPHGHCYLWTPGILWLHIMSDALIAIAYYSIPITLAWFVRKRRDIDFRWMFMCFAIFILACGTTHLMEIWNVWHGSYWLSGVVKALTAAASIPTAILLTQLMPQALMLPSPSTLQRANESLVKEINSRRLAEESLRKNGQLFAAFMDHLPGFAWMKDLEGRHTYVNAMLTQLEPRRAGWLGKTDKEVWPAEIASVHSANDETVIATRKALQTVEPYRRNDEVRQALVSKFPIFASSGAVEMVGGAGIDITELVQAEQAHAELAAIVESSEDAIISKTLDGVIVSWNEGATKIYGHAASEVIGRSITILAPPGHREEIDEILARIRRGESIEHFQTKRLRKDGTEISVSLTISPIKSRQGVIIGASTIARDISAQEKAERELRESEQRFRELAENIREVFWLSDSKNRRMDYISPAYERVWGRSCESLYAAPKSWMEAVHPQDKEQVLASVAMRTPDEPYHSTYRIVRPDGSIRWIRDRGFPVRDENGAVVRFAGIAEDITESKAIAEALENAEEQYRSIFNNAVNGIFRTSPDGKLLVANPASARIFGFASPEESIEARTEIAQQSYVDPHRRDELKRLLHEHGSVKGFEFEAYRKDGSRVWISENTRAVHSPTGEILYFEGIFEDVTERKRAEEALKESEARFRTIFEQAPLGISEGEIATARFISANQRYVDILGYTTDELRALTFKDYTHPEDLPKDLLEFQKLAAGRIRTYSMEKRYIRKDGRIIWVNLTVAGLAQPGEKPLNCLAVVEDITERRQAEDRLRRSEEKFKALFDLAPVGVAFLDSRLNIVDCNPELERMSRLSRGELLGAAWQRRTFLNSDGSPRLPGERVSDRAVTEKRLVKSIETGAVLDSGEIVWAEVSVAPLTVPDARGVVIMHDITKRKRAAEQLEKANRLLRVLSRRRVQVQEDERRHLARELHDQIGQALTAIKISVQSAKRSKKRDRIEANLDKAAAVLDQLLVQVRQITLDLRPAALDDLGLGPALRLVLHDYARRTGWHIRFVGDPNLERPDPEVETACFRIALEAMTNIVRHAHAQKVWLELHNAADSLHLIVRDDGVGFDAADAEKRVERDRLGLVGMRERAIAVGGGFECKSRPGRGTEVHALLPYHPS